MFFIYDTKEKRAVTRPVSLYANAVRACQRINAEKVGVEEIMKPEKDRRYIVKEGD